MVAVMDTVPFGSGGEVAWMVVSDTMVKEVAAVPPKDTLVTVRKLVPVSVTIVPPPGAPEFGLTLVMVGTVS